MKTKTRHILLILTAILATVLAGMTLHRALTSSFTHDESFTWNVFVTASLHDIFTYKVISPNNHLLNTLLMKAFSWMLGNAEIWLRMPNFLAHLGFMIFTFLMLRRMKPWLIFPLFAAINCNPYMLDFFALARGNGLGLFFEAGSLYFVLKFIREKRLKDYGWSVTLAFFGVLSHFTILYFFLALMTVANLWPWLQRFRSMETGFANLKGMIRINLINLIACLLLFLIMTGPILKMVRADQLFYGGETGFWKDTVGSLIETFLYGISKTSVYALALKGLVLLELIAVVFLILKLFRSKGRDVFSKNQELFFIFLLMMVAVGISVAQFHLIGTKLMIRRYGLMFAPLFLLCLAFLAEHFSERRSNRIFTGSIVYMLAFMFTLHTFRSFSGGVYLDWDYERNTKKMVTILTEDYSKSHRREPVTLGITWLYEPTVNFYRQVQGLTWLNPVTRDGPGITADYYYVLREDLHAIPLSGGSGYILFHDGKSILLK